MINFEKGKYEIIYADPPWRYRDKNSNGACENHYQTLSLRDIKILPVERLAHNNCVLFLWATFPLLPEAFAVIDAWGFKFKTVGFVWVKRNKKSPSFFYGLGHWTRANAEICLLATRGKPQRISKGVFQIIDTPIEKHSQKPAVARDRIVELLGNKPRIELFARQRIPGWDAWGNEI